LPGSQVRLFRTPLDRARQVRHAFEEEVPAEPDHSATQIDDGRLPVQVPDALEELLVEVAVDLVVQNTQAAENEELVARLFVGVVVCESSELE